VTRPTLAAALIARDPLAADRRIAVDRIEADHVDVPLGTHAAPTGACG
jgi:hypothetical protein